MSQRGKHIGCIGENCPICPRLAKPEYAGVRSNLSPDKNVSKFSEPLPCAYRGDVRRTESCVSCTRQTVDVFACTVHGECTHDKLVKGKDSRYLATCNGCKERSERPGGRTILLTGGIGDAITLEGMMTPEDREGIETIYYACRAQEEIAELFQALPNYPRLKHHIFLPTNETMHNAAEVEKAIGEKLPHGIEDWSIARIFPQRRLYTGSSLLIYKLAEAPALKPYAVIVPKSSWGGPKSRGLEPDEWMQVFAWLDRQNLAGVVLSRERNLLPKHHRLVDLQGKTTFLESVEILKGARAYLGIDSWMSVLAAKLLTPANLAIKSVRDHCYENRETYYAPRLTFPFLQRTLVCPT